MSTIVRGALQLIKSRIHKNNKKGKNKKNANININNTNYVLYI